MVLTQRFINGATAKRRMPKECLALLMTTQLSKLLKILRLPCHPLQSVHSPLSKCHFGPTDTFVCSSAMLQHSKLRQQVFVTIFDNSESQRLLPMKISSLQKNGYSK